MRPIFINGRFLTQLITGTQRYSHEILDQLDASIANSPEGWLDITVLVPSMSGALPKYRALKVNTVGRYSGRLWEQIELPFYARGGILFTPCAGAPILHRRNIVTIHDAAVFAAPAGYSSLYRIWYQWLYRRLCRKSLHIFTVSQYSKSELVKYCDAKPESITVTYLGSEHASRPVSDATLLTELGLRPFGYALTVSSRSPNKNIDGLLRAFAYFGEAGLDLVVAGAPNLRVFPAPADFPSSVVDVGYVSESTLRALYENAACFVFPSLYEGFGLPPLEAMAAGCPAVVSRAHSLAEIFGSIAFLCDPENPSDIARMVVEASNATAEQRFSYREFAKLFRWENCADTTWNMIAHLSDQPSRGLSVMQKIRVSG